MNPGDNHTTEQQRASGPADLIRVSHAGSDRAWAEWLCQQMADAGRRAEPVLLDPHTGDNLTMLLREHLDAADTVLVVATDTYFRAGSFPHSQWSSAFAALGPLFDKITMVTVAPCDVPQLPRPITWVDLSRRDETEARSVLLDRVVKADPGAPPMLAGGPVRARVRYPAEQPAVWSHLIPPRNVHFTGRDDALLDLRDRLSRGAAAGTPIALLGMGGVGKTQLAVEYAYRFATDYDVVWWVRAEHPAQASFDIADLALDLRVRVSADVGETVRTVLNALRQGRPYRNWLIIFDNAGPPEDMRHLLPSGHGHILVTTRTREWQPSADYRELDVYEREESIRFLQHRIRGITLDDANKLAEEFQDLPLALDSAAAWLSATSMPISDYLDLTRRQMSDTFNQARLPGYGAVVMAWTLPMNRLREEYPAAAQLLRLSAFLGPEPVPVTLFSGRSGAASPPVTLPSPLHQEICHPTSRGRIFREIGKYAVAKIGYRTGQDIHDTETIQVHRVVQQVLREMLSTNERESFKRTAQLLVAAADPGTPDIGVSWPLYAELFQHIGPADMTSPTTDPSVRRFILNQIRCLYMRGELAASKDLADTAKESWSSVLKERDNDMIALNNNLANSLRALGLYQEARDLETQNLRVVRDHLGPDHLDALQAAGGHAATLRRLGEWSAAYEYDEDTLDRAVRVYGADHPRSMLAANNFAVALRMVGRFTRALQVDEDNMRRRERIFGPNHQYTLLSANNVARDLRECGRYQESAGMQERTYSRYVELFGPHHPDTLRAMKNLAVSRRKAGRYAEAEDLGRACLAAHREKFKAEYPESIAACTNYANDLRMVGNHADALRYAEEALQLSRSTLGDNHPYTLGAATNTAIAYRVAGSPATAREINEGAAEGFKLVLGDDHPYTLACLTNLASDLRATGQPDRAAELGETLLNLLRQSRGADHPYTLAAAVNLAADRRAAGDEQGAEALQQETFGRYESTIGPDHPEAVAARQGQRADCDVEPPPA